MPHTFPRRVRNQDPPLLPRHLLHEKNPEKQNSHRDFSIIPLEWLFKAEGNSPRLAPPCTIESRTPSSWPAIAQINANRLNAKLSTGPKSEMGKKVAAANSATKGGISGRGKSLSTDLWNQVVATKVVLAQGNPPKDDYDTLLLEDAAIARVLMLECDDRLAGLSESQADTARIGWQNQREIEAGDLAQQLGRHPHRTSRTLQQTPQGCQYLIDLWRVVEVDLRQQGALTDPTRDRLLNLLGVTPDVRIAGLTELDAPADDPTDVASRAPSHRGPGAGTPSRPGRLARTEGRLREGPRAHDRRHRALAQQGRAALDPVSLPACAGSSSGV